MFRLRGLLRCTPIIIALSLWWIFPLLAQDEFPAADRIVAVGDVHGDFDRFSALLRDAGVIDKKQKWIGGRTHLVQTGDFVDRGPESRKVMDLLMRLEEQALKAGGRVHVLLGNHETMNLFGDLRYVTEGEYAAFRTPRSKEVRDAYFEEYVQAALQKGHEAEEERRLRSKWYAEHPLGWFEHRFAFGPNGTYGKWLRQKNAVIKIGGILFLHAGISPKYSAWSIRQINDAVRKELADFALLENGVVTDSAGPLWYRGLAEAPEADASDAVDDLLARHQVKHIVVGHTPTRGAVLPRFGGKVILIDVGLSEFYGGPLACLIVEKTRFQALHRGTPLDLPLGTETGWSAYVKAAAALDPPPSPLEPLISGSGGGVLLSTEQ
ncbi:MAG: protein-tyrosine-phosphatase [Acidobacteria bacterium]|nr:MAG: protein-tyrosine-phosphatase [Acidobacteriota bacterium]